MTRVIILKFENAVNHVLQMLPSPPLLKVVNLQEVWLDARTDAAKQKRKNI